MTGRRTMGWVVVALALAVSLDAQSKRPEVQLQEALNKERIAGDIDGAINLLKPLAEHERADIAARALVALGRLYDRRGEAQARGAFERVVRQFPNQAEAAKEARAWLAAHTPAAATRTGTTLRDVEGLNPSGYAINVSADGRYAAHVNGVTGNIAVRDLQSATSRDITRRKDFIVQDPIISRDAIFVAYQSFGGCVEGRPSTRGNGDLCVLPVAGEPSAAPRTLLARADVEEIAPMDWSPDGRSLAVVLHRKDGTAQVGIVSLADGAVRTLKTTDWRGATRVFFSPDGQHVAFDFATDETSDSLSIEVVAVDGSRGATVVQHASQNVVMGWTPDGSHLFFVSDRSGSLDLWVQRVSQGRAEGSSRLVHAGLGGARSLGVTKSGDLYFEVQSGNHDIEIATIDLAAGKQVATAVHPVSRYVGTNSMPMWSRDGKSLAYVSSRGFSANNEVVIGIRDASTGAIRDLRPKLIYSFGLAWAPDGSKLLTNGTDTKGRGGIFAIDASTGEASLVGSGSYPSYAPDGKHLYYMKGETGERSIVERSLTSGTERTIAEGQFLRATLSPDGRWFSAASGGTGGAAAEVIAIDAATGKVRTLYQAQPGDNIPTGVNLPWTPDGQAVLMRKRPPLNELWLVPTTGAPPRRIDADVKSWSFGIRGALSVHPDGRQIAATRVRQDPGAPVRVLENVVSTLK